jgi:hypothetical protein
VGYSCLIGYEVTFDEDFIEFQQEKNTDFTKFDEWLSENTVPEKGITYMEYMPATIKTTDGKIDTSKKHIIMWRARWVIAGVTARGLASSEIYFAPEEEARVDPETEERVCTELYN